MSAGRIVLPPYYPAFDRNGDLSSGALLYVYQNLTNTLVSVFYDEELIIPLPNPVEANTSGQFPNIYVDAGTIDAPVLYTLAITGANGQTIGNPSVFDNYQASVDYNTAAVVLAEAAAAEAVAAAAIAVAAAGSLTGSGLAFGPYTGNGAQTVFAMAEAVEAGDEFAVELFVAGVYQEPDGLTYSTDGSANVTFSTPPGTGATVEGVHVARSVAVSVTPPPAAVVPSGRKLSTTARFARNPDLYDWATIYKNGMTDDGPGLAAAFAYAPVWSHASGVIRINSNTTIPINTALSVTRGQFYIASGVTLTILGDFDAPDRFSVFTGPGEVRGLVKASAHWFGALGNYNEAISGGGTTADDGPAWTKALRASQTVYGLDLAYAIVTDVIALPTLAKATYIEGAGTSKVGSGTRFYSKGGKIWMRGTLGLADPSSNAEWGLKDFAVYPSTTPNATGVLVAGDGGGINAILTGLDSNVIDNVFVGEFATNMAVKSATKVVIQNCRFDSQVTAGVSLQIGLSTGGTICSEIALSRVVCSQPTAAPGIAFLVDNVELGGPSIAEVRGIVVDADSQFYGGTGQAVKIYSIAAGTTHTLGDITFAPGTKFQGTSPTAGITTDNLLYIEAKDGAKISSIKAIGCQFESCEGTAIQAIITASVATFGAIHDLLISGCTFRYHKNRSIGFEGVYGLSVIENHLQFCGATTGATAVEHIFVTNGLGGRVENNTVTESDAGTWIGLARGLTVSGAATKNVRSRNNAAGTGTAFNYASAYPNSGDSADQPSLIAQV